MLTLNHESRDYSMKGRPLIRQLRPEWMSPIAATKGFKILGRLGDYFSIQSNDDTTSVITVYRDIKVHSLGDFRLGRDGTIG